MKSKKERSSLTLAGLFLFLLCLPLFCVNSASAAAYSITINTKFNGVSNGNTVSIIEDGTFTGFNTPHTFSGLSGAHNFSVPYEDSKGHPFYEWDNKVPTDCVFTTITASSSGTYWAFYDAQVPRNSGGTVGAVSPAEQRYYVTPSDPAVVAAAANKSWSDILNWVASRITYNFSETNWQFPNETLSLGSGQCRDYSTLCVSMLLSRGYTAYVVTGNVTAASGVNTGSGNGHAWVVIRLDGALYHLEPQRTWANQPSPQNFSLGYFADYFNDNNELLPAAPSLDPPAAQTYDVAIETSFSTIPDDAHVAISRDGLPTGFTTPHTFAGLSGVHNFSVPYADASGCSFMSWSTNVPGEQIYPTITVSSGGTFTAFYDSQFSLSRLCPAENRYLITPFDPVVVSAAANKNFTDIVDFVSALPYAVCQTAQFPNQTLSHGTCFQLDLATTCVSMLRSAGYVAYLVEGNTSTLSNTYWVVFSHNGVFYHVDPQQSWKNQQTVSFGSYQANFYIDENGIYPASTSQDPPATLPSPSPTIAPNATPTPTRQIPEFSAGLAFALLALVLAVLVALKRRAAGKKTG